MIVQFARWGNSLAVRIPAGMVKELGAAEGLAADVMVSDGRLVLTPVKRRKVYCLADLVAGITDDNLHPEISTGYARDGEYIE